MNGLTWNLVHSEKRSWKISTQNFVKMAPSKPIWEASAQNLWDALCIPMCGCSTIVSELAVKGTTFTWLELEWESFSTSNVDSSSTALWETNMFILLYLLHWRTSQMIKRLKPKIPTIMAIALTPWAIMLTRTEMILIKLIFMAITRGAITTKTSRGCPTNQQTRMKKNHSCQKTNFEKIFIS